MSRSIVVSLSLFVWAATAAGQPAGPVTLKSPSAGAIAADQFFASGLAVWAGQISNETAVLKAELTASLLAPQVKAALVRSTDATTRVAAAFHRSTLSTTDRARLARQHQALDGPLTGLTAPMQRTGVVLPGVAQSLARMQYADEQIHAALHTGADWRVRISHLAATLSEQADELRGQFVDILPVPNRSLDRLVRAFASSCDRLSENVD